MVGARSSSPDFMVVEGTLFVHLAGVPPAPGPELVTVECSSKKAYGCGELGEKLFQGLTLYLRRLGCADLNSSLSIGLSDEAIRSIQEELGVPLRLRLLGAKGPLPDVQGYVRVADNGVLVLSVNFHCWDNGNRAYYLAYDATDASLYMIPFIPSNVEAIYTVTPVPARPTGGRGHELALVAQKLWPQPERGRLCVCTPATREVNPSAPDDGTATGPWEIKVHRNFPAPPQDFSVDLMFSFTDKVFWADLSHGIAYSDLRQGGPVVDTVFIPLPDGYVIDFYRLPKNVQIVPAKMSRTMSCIEGSIKFVCTDCGVTTRCPGNEMVIKVWTLDLDGRLWKEEAGLTCPWEVLWVKACAMNDSLRDMQRLEPQYPVLMPDGALCLILPRKRHRIRGPPVKRPDYICSFDIVSKSCLCFGQVRSYHVIDPVVLPYNFFKNCCPSYKRKPPTHKRKLPSIDVPVPACSLAVIQ
ncbi:unnamed protein product [Urochloa humidicola]